MVCVRKLGGAPDDMAAAARAMNEYLDMFPQVRPEALPCPLP